MAFEGLRDHVIYSEFEELLVRFAIRNFDFGYTIYYRIDIESF